jgi:hypothetical protein
MGVVVLAIFHAHCARAQNDLERRPHLENCERLFTIIAENDFRNDRNLYDYVESLPPEFSDYLYNLKPGQRVIDFGGGEGFAGEMYPEIKFNPELAGPDFNLNNFGLHIRAFLDKLWRKPFAEKGEAKVISYKVARQNVNTHDKFKLLKDRFFEDIPDYEIGQYDIGIFRNGLDLYTPHLDIVLHKVFRLLKSDGVIFLNHGGYSGNTLIQTADGTFMTYDIWLETRVRGIKVKRVLSNDTVPVEGKNLIIRRRRSIPLEVPRLQLVFIDESVPPPMRVFEEVGTQPLFPELDPK